MSNEEYEKIIAQICAKGDFNSLDTFEKNIIAIDNYSMPLAAQILEAQHSYKVDIENNNIFTLNIDFGGEKLLKNPILEVNKELEEFSTKKRLYPALFIYGMSNGVLVKALLENSKHETIVVFEPDAQLLFILFHLIDFSADLLKNRLIILNSAACDAKTYYIVANQKGVFESARIYDLHLNGDYYERFKDDILEVNANFIKAFARVIKTYCNDPKDEMDGICHTVEHIPAMIDGFSIKNIVEQRKDKVKTAILVATGPSLAKQIPLLKQARGKASIICADASYAILKKHGIKPDYVTSVERIKWTSEFFNSEVSDFDEKIIFVCASLTHPNTIKYLKNRNICLVFKPTCFEFGFEDNDFGYIGGGHSCMHLAYELAEALGHEKIIMIGQDLAYAKDNATTHSQGHLYGSSDKGLENASIGGQAIAYGSDGVVKTLDVWELFRGEFEDYFATLEAEKRPYNCTEGGARIQYTKEVPFAQMIEAIKDEKKPDFALPKKNEP